MKLHDFGGQTNVVLNKLVEFDMQVVEELGSYFTVTRVILTVAPYARCLVKSRIPVLQESSYPCVNVRCSGH